MVEYSQIRLTKYAQIQAAIREQFFSGTLQVGALELKFRVIVGETTASFSK